MTDNETELRSLLTRVMSAPLHPLQEKIDSIELRIAKLEGTTIETRLATRQVSEGVNAAQTDLRKRLSGLLDDLQEGLAERIDPIAGKLIELDQQQQSVLATLGVARGEASQRGDELRGAVAACDNKVLTSLAQLEELRARTATADAHHTVMLDASLERLKALHAAADAATARHGEALAALQHDIFAALDAARGEASEQVGELRVSVAACANSVQTSLTQLGDLRATTATADANKSAMLEALLERLREFRAAADAATARDGEALAALLGGQKLAAVALAQQHDLTQEIGVTQYSQQTAQQNLATALPALLTDLRTDLEAALSSHVDLARVSILSGTGAQVAERQHGVLAQLKLLRTLTVVNLLALGAIACLTIVQFVGRS